MDFFIVILLFIKLALVFCVVVLPALACGGFAALGWFARRIRNARLRVGVCGIAIVGMLTAATWSISNGAIGAVQWVVTWP